MNLRRCFRFLHRVFFTRQFITFIAVGMLAALANFLSRIYFQVYVSLTAALVLSYLVGMSVAFILHRSFTFALGIKPVFRQLSIFISVNLLGLMETVLVTLLFLYWIFPAIHYDFRIEESAHIIGLAMPMFTSFLGHKFLSFGSVKISSLLGIANKEN